MVNISLGPQAKLFQRRYISLSQTAIWFLMCYYSRRKNCGRPVIIVIRFVTRFKERYYLCLVPNGWRDTRILRPYISTVSAISLMQWNPANPATKEPGKSGRINNVAI